MITTTQEEEQIFSILSMKDFNSKMRIKWKKDTEEQISKGEIFNLPNIKDYVFFDKANRERENGFVIEYGNNAICVKTIENAEKEIKRLINEFKNLAV